MRLAVASLVFLSIAVVPAGGAARSTSEARPQLFVSPSGSDAGSCTRAAPCASFARAYVVAKPGSIVNVAGGRYANQEIPARPSRKGRKVILRPAGRARVTVTGEFFVRGSYVELRNMNLRDLEIPREAHHVTFRNIRNRGFWMQGPSNISFIGGEVTCGVCPYHPQLQAGAGDGRPPRKILFDGVNFHDWHAAGSEHTECLQIGAGNGITIRNSVFKNCGTANGGRGATANLHISWFGRGPVTRNIVIENNFFYRSGNAYAIQAGDYAGLELRYNSIVGPILVGGGWGDGTPVRFVGNIMGFGDCQAPRTGSGPVAPFVYSHNVLQGGKCDGTDRDAPSGFIDPNRNLRLRRGAAAINRGNPKSYPRRDIDGQKRPRGGRPDAGADEAR
jgi:hypothetical protein